MTSSTGGASPGAAADAAAGPDSFARLLDAADARRSAEQAPSAKSPRSGPDRPGADDEGAPDTPAGSDAATADPAALLASLAGLGGLPVPPLVAAAAPAGADAPAQRPGSGPGGRAARTATLIDATRGSASAAPAATPGAGNAVFDILMGAANAHAALSAPGAPGVRSEAALAAALGDGPALARTPLPAGADTAAPPLALLATGGPGAGGVAGGALTTRAEAQLSAAPGSAEFARQLGTQLTTFVRGGVQHARLELHPLELGPVTVQIQLDGDQAHVRLAAEHPHTRQALEQALPTLAGSLREAGLTLSGGGVSDQPRQPPPEAQPAARGGRSADGALEARPDAADGAPRRRGVVDLVA